MSEYAGLLFVVLILAFGILSIFYLRYLQKFISLAKKLENDFWVSMGSPSTEAVKINFLSITKTIYLLLFKKYLHLSSGSVVFAANKARILLLFCIVIFILMILTTQSF